MSIVRILLEVHSTQERTPQELADIAAGRLTSCLGVDQSVPEPVIVCSAETVFGASSRHCLSANITLRSAACQSISFRRCTTPCPNTHARPLG